MDTLKSDAEYTKPDPEYSPAGNPNAEMEARDATSEKAELTPSTAAQRLKSQVRILKLCQRIASFFLSIVITVTMSLTLSKYLQTRHTTVNGQSPWPTDTLLWPTIVLLAIAASALLLYAGILVSYFVGGVKAANHATNFASIFTITFGIMKVGAWLVATALYQVGSRSGRDLRSWSCGGSDNLQPAVQAVVNFNLICQSNTGMFHLSYISAIIEAFGVVIWIWMARRYFSKRALIKAREEQEGA